MLVTIGTQPVALEDLEPYPGNARRGNVALILESLRANGQYKPLTVRRHGETLTILAGNHTYLAMLRHEEDGRDACADWELANDRPCQLCINVDRDDPTTLAHLIECDDATAARINLVDNKAADVGDYDEAALAAILATFDGDLVGTGFALSEAEMFTGSTDVPADFGEAADPEFPEAAEEVIAEPPADPVTKTGDVWILGPHRLMCGDSREPGDLATLVDGRQPDLIYTDPPYGIAIVNGGKIGGGGPFGGKKAVGKVGGDKIVPASNYLPVAGDDTTDTAADSFRHLMTEYPEVRHVWWGGNHYASTAGLPDSSCWLVWDKENTGNFADAELAWTNHPGAVRLLRHMWNGMLRASERGKRVHPTQKPVALAEWAFSVVDPDHARETVLDAFGGSGSTLLACHTTGRVGLVMEMEPAYCDVICRRYQQATGVKPALERTGESHDFLEGGAA